MCATVLKKRGPGPKNIGWNSNCRACFIEQVTMEDNAKVVAAVIFWRTVVLISADLELKVG